MREHPIPQDIVGYRFHIIGSMTLKQFAELALGAILGLIVYATNLPPVIKWPLIFIAAALGAAAAFLPIEERPLDHWITTFFQTLYKPTKFFWKKSSKVPELFLFKVGAGVMEKKDELDLSPIRRKRIKEYLDSTKSISDYQDKYDQDNQEKINQIMKTFEEIVPNKVEIIKQIKKPDLKTRTRSLKSLPIAEEEVVIYKNTSTKDKKNPSLLSEQVAKTVAVPVTEITSTQTHSTVIQEEKIAVNQQQAAYAISSDINNHKETTKDDVVFNASLPFPSKPTIPNKLVGMILTHNNELVPEAIIEIKDEQNRVVRAVKSNALGQFFISTPLKRGGYTVVTTHPKYQFNSQEITLKNELVEPIEVKSLS